jgi:predicted permease
LSHFLQLFSDIMLPVLLMAAAGYAAQRLLKLDPRPLTQIVFYILSPALIFVLIVSSNIGGQDMLRMVGAAFLLIATIGLVGYLLGKALRLEKRLLAAFVLSVMFMNAGNFGLPVSQYAFGEEGLAWASLFFIVCALMVSSIGIYISQAGSKKPLEALISLAKMPVIYAILAAILVRALGWEVPQAIYRPLETLKAAAVPCMVLLLGMQIAQCGFPRRWGLIALALGLRLVISPLLASGYSLALSLPGPAHRIAILQAAMPTAVFTTILANEFDVQPQFVTGAVMVSTLIGPLTITPILALLGA